MAALVQNLFIDLGVELDTQYFTPQQIIVILAFVFGLELVIRFIASITDFARK